MADSLDCRHWVAKAEEDAAVVRVLADKKSMRDFCVLLSQEDQPGGPQSR